MDTILCLTRTCCRQWLTPTLGGSGDPYPAGTYNRSTDGLMVVDMSGLYVVFTTVIIISEDTALDLKPAV